jgi:hypothetical protein
VAAGEEVVDVVEVVEIVGTEVTGVLLTVKVVERSLGAGSEKMLEVGALQLTVSPSDSVPQHDQSCVTLLYTIS